MGEEMLLVVGDDELVTGCGGGAIEVGLLIWFDVFIPVF